MTLAVKVVLNPNTTNQPISFLNSNSVNQFLLFTQCFHKLPYFGSLKYQSKILSFCRARKRAWGAQQCGRLEQYLGSSTGGRPASYCHDFVSICPFVCACVCKLFLQKTSPQKLLTGFLPNFTGMFRRWSSFKFLRIIVFHEEFTKCLDESKGDYFC